MTVRRQKLWAPWRLAYIKNSDWKKPAGCILCTLQEQADGPGNLILDRSALAYLIMNRFPYTNGHLMVVPKRHTADFASLTAEESADVMALLQKGTRALERAYRTHGFNIGMNLGRVAGAGIDEHLHFHIVPRWNGDTNFMPVLADVNVVNDHLETAYHGLREALLEGAGSSK
ncbi:MAG: HIT domain-containing protein [Bdellovibrionota bacterium]